MDFLQIAVSEIVSIVGFTLLLFGAIKAYQIKAELTEIKDLLGDIKRNTTDYSGQAPYQTPDQVLRSLDDKSYAE